MQRAVLSEDFPQVGAWLR